MKALTICQPWAWAIMAGHKRVENRTWSTSYRGPLLIHAGMSRKWDRDGLAFLAEQGLEPPADLVRGAILGRVELVDVVPYPTHRGLFAADDPHNLAADPFAFGEFCWILSNPVLFDRPITYRGQLALFDVPAHLLPA